jgi:chemotaxis protein MotB
MEKGKTARVLGLAASVPLDKAHPDNPINRRISIIVMTREAEAAALSQDVVDSRPQPVGNTTAAIPQGTVAKSADTAPDAVPPVADTPAQSGAPVAAMALPVPPTLRPAGR